MAKPDINYVTAIGYSLVEKFSLFSYIGSAGVLQFRNFAPLFPYLICCRLKNSCLQ